jgi:hypothetical protein
LIHPSNLIAVASILMLGLMNLSVHVLLLGLGTEICFACLAPKNRWFQRCLDQSLKETEESAARRARELLMAEMSEGHRDELVRLDGLIKKIDESDAQRSLCIVAADDLDLHGLAASYIRLALAHKACEEALSRVEQKSQKTPIRSLEAIRQTSSERVRAVIGERLAVAHRRAAYEERLREDLEVISHQLATIADLVCLRHEETLTVGPSAEAERFRQYLDEARSAVVELAELDNGERTPIKTEACA